MRGVQHLRFFDSSYPHYDLLKRSSVKQQQPKPRIKEEVLAKGNLQEAGLSHRNLLDLEEGTRDHPISVEDYLNQEEEVQLPSGP